MYTGRIGLILAVLSALVIGCGQTASTIDRPTAHPFEDRQLTVACLDELPLPIVTEFARQWSQQQDARVTAQLAAATSKQSDIAIVRVADLPQLVETGHYLPIEPDWKARNPGYRWETVLPNYAGLFSTWNKKAYGIPLRGEGHVLIYRKDHFTSAKLKIPETWEDYLQAAKTLSAAHGASLPSLPSSAIELETQFHLIAACYDQPAFSYGEAATGPLAGERADRYFSYQYDLKKLEPRINAKAFVHALKLLQQMTPLRAKRSGGNRSPNVDLLLGKASLAIVSLRDLAELQALESPMRGKFGIALLPGARFTFDRDSGAETPVRGNTVNRVPYCGADSFVGLISTECAHPEMALAFLMDFGNPDKMGAETIVAARWGAGPFRASQLEERSRDLWFGYNLDGAETEHLVAALRETLTPNIVNHRFPLRLPNEQPHREEFDRHIRQALAHPTADAQTAMDALNESWNALWRSISPATKARWIVQNYGL